MLVRVHFRMTKSVCAHTDEYNNNEQQQLLSRSSNKQKKKKTRRMNEKVRVREGVSQPVSETSGSTVQLYLITYAYFDMDTRRKKEEEIFVRPHPSIHKYIYIHTCI